VSPTDSDAIVDAGPCLASLRIEMKQLQQAQCCADNFVKAAYNSGK
jgi:hypothetical protein